MDPKSTPRPKSRWKTSVMQLCISLVLIAVVMYVISRSDSPNETAVKTRNTVSSMGLVQLALESYYNAHTSYPKAGGQCVPVTSVTTELMTAGFLPKNFAEKLPESYPIHISVSSDSLNYVLESEGKGFTGNSILASDVDGVILGCNCDDPNYCTRP